MFDETLLDSSPKRAPVLKSGHWLISVGVGILGFLAWYFGVSVILGPPDSTKALVTQSAIFGGIPLMLSALMLCYIHADTQHLGLNTWLWFAVVLFLSLVGFVLYLIYSAAKTDNWKRATLPIAYIFEGILVGVTVLIPLIYTEALPKAQLMTFLAAPPPPPPPPPPAAAPPKVAVKRVSVEDLMRAPTVIPKTIMRARDEPEPPPQAAAGVVGGVPGGVPGGSSGGVIGGIIGGLGSAPPPPPPPKAATPKRIRVGGQVEQARWIFHPNPEYPPLAKMARIQGVVRLEAIIDTDGMIKDLKPVSGHPMLVKAAMDAVSRWRYQPTFLNGEPVQVATEIDVNFTLSE